MSDQPQQRRPASPLPVAYDEKLSEIDGTARSLQKQLAALAAEAKYDGKPFVSMVSILERKAGAVGHLREDLATIPQRVAEEAGGGS
jgi:hypothetical protein